MRLKFISVAILLFTMCVVSSGFSFEDKWFLMTAEEFGYQIEFPKEPVANTQTINTKAGPVDMHINLLDLTQDGEDKNMVYLSSFAEYDESLVHSNKVDQLDDFFKETVEGLVKGVNGKLLVQNKIQLGEYQGREMKIDFQNGIAIIWVRVYLVENRVYMLQIISKTENDGNPSIKRFMDSFSLLDS